MRVLRAVAGALVWVLAGVVGLLGALLSVTLILLPVGIPLLFLARKLFRLSMALFLPRMVRHPAQDLGRRSRHGAKGAADRLAMSGTSVKHARKHGRKLARKTRKRVAGKLGRKDHSLVGRLKRAA